MSYNSDTFEDMIPQYINDQLNADQKALFENQLAKDNQLKEEVEEYSMIKSSYSQLSDTMLSPSPDVFSRIMENIEPEKEKNRTEESFFDSIFEYIKEFLFAPKLAWSVAAVQMAVILFFIAFNPDVKKDATKFQTLSSNVQVETGIQANVIFHDKVMEKDIRTLLNRIDATIVSGPLKNGLYVILIKDAENEDHLLKALKTSDLIKFVQKKY